MLNDEWMHFLQTQEMTHTPVMPSVDAETTAPEATALYISTTTKIIYTHQSLDIISLFWQMELISYSDNIEGILKKQMKFIFNSKEELQTVQDRLSQIHDRVVTQEMISFHDSNGRMKFRDVRKISIGVCSKDLVLKAKKRAHFITVL